MSWAEDYQNPFPDECEHGRHNSIDCEECFLDSLEADESDWECMYPGRCLMPSPLHHHTECHTVADMEAYYKEMEGL